MTTPIITTGVPTTPGSDGSVPVRHEIRDLQQNYPLQWNLFCLGLLALQTVDESDQLSYYQIAGIHGLPYKAWNGVPGIDGQQSGYCTHSSILFLPWHRPYLCLFEQLLCNKIQDIANSFTDSLRSQYVGAAQDFRLPYWDWGLLPQSGRPAFPASMAGPAQINVTGIDGKQQVIPNPLQRYNFNVTNLSSGDFPDAPYNTWATTHRYPEDSSANTVSQDTFVNSAVSSQTSSIRSQIRYVMGSISEFGPFSNDKWIPANPGTYPSLEDIHDNIHVLVGGPSPGNQSAPAGNMSIIPYAAFDPVFWLHHCNVDRLFAIFQALHPDSYVKPEPTSDGTFTEPPGYTEDIGSDLTPFWKDNSTFHTSESAKATVPLGYAYPETQSWNYATPDLYQQSVRVAMRKLYGTTITQSVAITSPLPVSLTAAAGFKQMDREPHSKPVLSREIKVEDDIKHPVTISTVEIDPDNKRQTPKTSFLSDISNRISTTTGKVKSFVHQGDEPPTDISNGGTTDVVATHKYKEWITNIRVRKHCLGGAFQVHVFLGNVPANVSSWLIDDSNVGTCSVLGSNPTTTNCEKCRKDASENLIVTGVVPLTESLLDAILKGNLGSLEVGQVVPYLRKNLHWRVTQPDGTVKPPNEVDDLKVSVVSTEVTDSTASDELPLYSGEYTLHPECTQGKPAGYNVGDQY